MSLEVVSVQYMGTRMASKWLAKICNGHTFENVCCLA